MLDFLRSRSAADTAVRKALGATDVHTSEKESVAEGVLAAVHRDGRRVAVACEKALREYRTLSQAKRVLQYVAICGGTMESSFIEYMQKQRSCIDHFCDLCIADPVYGEKFHIEMSVLATEALGACGMVPLPTAGDPAPEDVATLNSMIAPLSASVSVADENPLRVPLITCTEHSAATPAVPGVDVAGPGLCNTDAVDTRDVHIHVEDGDRQRGAHEAMSLDLSGLVPIDITIEPAGADRQQQDRLGTDVLSFSRVSSNLSMSGVHSSASSHPGLSPRLQVGQSRSASEAQSPVDELSLSSSRQLLGAGGGLARTRSVVSIGRGMSPPRRSRGASTRSSSAARAPLLQPDGEGIDNPCE